MIDIIINIIKNLLKSFINKIIINLIKDLIKSFAVKIDRDFYYILITRLMIIKLIIMIITKSFLNRFKLRSFILNKSKIL